MSSDFPVMDCQARAAINQINHAEQTLRFGMFECFQSILPFQPNQERFDMEAAVDRQKPKITVDLRQALIH